MDLSIDYMGLKLLHPFMPGASPLVNNLDIVKRIEDAGASAIIMYSLFEEQIVAEQMAALDHLETPAESFAEALSYFPSTEVFGLGPQEYLEQIRRIKETVSIPVIGSLNGYTQGGWLEYAKLIEQAGADALELNVYHLETDPQVSGQAVEERTIDVIRSLKTSVKIPMAVKLSPFYSSVSNFCCQLDALGVDALVLFNRFYQPDIDIENLEVERSFQLSDSRELLLRLRWMAILSGRVKASLAASGGVHDFRDAIKAIMTGASAVQILSAFFKHANGQKVFSEIRNSVEEWLIKHEYESLRQMRGSMSLKKCPDPSAYERANYAYVLQSWQKYLDAKIETVM